MIKIAEMIPLEFLEELLGVLGSPSRIIVSRREEPVEDGSMKLHTGYSERDCECDNSTILRIYGEQYSSHQKLLKPLKKEELVQEIPIYGTKELSWLETDKEAKYLTVILDVKFTPYDFNVSMRRNGKETTYEKLLDLIEKYKPPHTIKLL